MVAEVEVRIESDPRRLRFVRAVVGRSCRALGAGDEAAEALVLAVNEAVANVMRHAYGGDVDQPIRIRCRRAGDMVEVLICDHGKSGDVLSERIDPPDELRSGGRGLFLIRSLVDEFEFRSKDGSNRMHLRKRVPVLAGGG